MLDKSSTNKSNIYKSNFSLRTVDGIFPIFILMAGTTNDYVSELTSSSMGLPTTKENL